jgi:predicted Zn-dependent peptidase
MHPQTNIHYLSNEIPVILRNAPFHTCKILFSLHFGASDETAPEYGITHFIEHLLGQSTTGDRTFGNLTKKIEILGGAISLYTTYNKIGCYINTLPEHLIDTIQIIAPQIMSPVFDTEKIEQEKHIILTEHKRYIAQNSWFLFAQKNLFKNTGLGHSVTGTPETIESFTPEALSKYYHSHLSSDKFNIVVIGQINDTEKLLSELENAFGNMPHIPYKRKSWTTTPIIAHDCKQDTCNTKLVLAFADKIPDTRKDQIATGLFKKILHDRLINALRYQNGLVYSVKCLTMGVGNTKLYTIETETQPHQIESIAKIIASECTNILTTHQITSKELQIAKNVIKYQNTRVMDSIDKSCETYAQYMNHYGKVYDFDVENSELNTLTISDITKTGHAILTSPISIITQGPEQNDNIINIWNKNFITLK